MKSTLALSLMIGLLIPGLTFAESERKPPRRPPPEAVAACSNKKDGDACKFTAPHGEVTGTCHPCQEQIACVPPHPPRDEDEQSRER